MLKLIVDLPTMKRAIAQHLARNGVHVDEETISVTQTGAEVVVGATNAVGPTEAPEPSAASSSADAEITALNLRARFYESVTKLQPHNRRGRCRLAEAIDVGCCNPLCNGDWGTGCWCCHALSFTVDAEPEAMRLHLALAALNEDPLHPRVYVPGQTVALDSAFSRHGASYAAIGEVVAEVVDPKRDQIAMPDYARKIRFNSGDDPECLRYLRPPRFYELKMGRHPPLSLVVADHYFHLSSGLKD